MPMAGESLHAKEGRKGRKSGGRALLVILPESQKTLNQQSDLPVSSATASKLASVCGLLDDKGRSNCFRRSRGFGRCVGGRTGISERVRRLAVLWRD